MILTYIMRCSMSLLCCFLGRFLPKLGGASAPPFFIAGCDADTSSSTQNPLIVKFLFKRTTSDN
jgi:hypothetical protein